MPAAVTPSSMVYEDGSAWLLARVIAADGEPVQQADLTAITIKVFDEDADDDPVETHTATLDKTQVIFDTLQVDARWTADSTGYNLRIPLPPAAFPTGGNTCKIEVRMVDAAEGVYWVFHRAKVQSAITS